MCFSRGVQYRVRVLFYNRAVEASVRLMHEGYCLPLDVPAAIQQLVDEGLVPLDEFIDYTADRWTGFFIDLMQDESKADRFFEILSTPRYYSTSGFERYASYFEAIENAHVFGPDTTILDVGSGVPVVASTLAEKYGIPREKIDCIDRCTEVELRGYEQKSIFKTNHKAEHFGGDQSDSHFAFEQVNFYGGVTITDEISPVAGKQYDVVLALNSIIPNTSGGDIVPSIQKAIMAVKPGGHLIIGGGTFLQIPVFVCLVLRKTASGGLQLVYSGSEDNSSFLWDEDQDQDTNLVRIYGHLQDVIARADTKIYYKSE